jgi:hypothetical protein
MRCSIGSNHQTGCLSRKSWREWRALARGKTTSFRMPNARNVPSDDAQQSAFAEAAVAHLQPLLPRIARENLVGGPRSALQLSEADRRRQIRLALLADPGTNGSTLLDAAKTLVFINGYARARG